MTPRPPPKEAGGLFPRTIRPDEHKIVQHHLKGGCWNLRSLLYMDTSQYFLSPPGRIDRTEAVIPLPFPGEGGPVYPGDDIASEPTIPLPFPGEGGPVYPGDDIIVEPVIPLPFPGEGGPVYPGNNNGTVILPGVIRPPQSGTARTRFLNAAYGYPSFRISIGGRQFTNWLDYASVTGYGRVRTGYHTVTVMGRNGRIYLQKTMPFHTNGLTTMAIIRTAGGLDLLQIPDSCCPPSNGWSSFRVVHLAYNSGPLDVLMSDGRVVYGDLRYKEAAAFRRIMPGIYRFFYADTDLTPMPGGLDIEGLDPAWLDIYPPHETFGSLYLNVSSGEIYTIYLLQSGSGRDQIQNLILVDR
ncbi:DUF4397 domain-containing protein [bacterium 1xD42-67]|nr:DUF4397 domain-containing protein [bacterium 1xD42-67]